MATVYDDVYDDGDDNGDDDYIYDDDNPGMLDLSSGLKTLQIESRAV